MDENTFNSTVVGLAESIVLAALASGPESATRFIENMERSALMNDPQAQRVMFIIAGRAKERLTAWESRSTTIE